MKYPLLASARNLIWSRAATPWSIWRLSPLPYGYRAHSDKVAARAAHTVLLRGLVGESLLLGLCAQSDPLDVVQRMLDGVDVSSSPAWVAECEATLSSLSEVPLGERSFWLALPLGSAGRKRYTVPAGAALADLRERLGLPRWVPSPAAIEEAARRADDLIRASVPNDFRPRAATPAEVAWLLSHLQRRGGLLEDPVPDTPVAGAGSDAVTTGRGLPRPLIDEGGRSDLPSSAARVMNPLGRRFLKVSDPAGPAQILPPCPPDEDDDAPDHESDSAQTDLLPQASYQALLTLDQVPIEGMAFPGSEFLGRLDDCGLDVDFAVRLHVINSEEAKTKIRKTIKDLEDQFEQRESVATTGHHELGAAQNALHDFEGALASDSGEVQVNATVILAVAGPTAQAAQDQARELQRYFETHHYRVGLPVGQQETLWWASHPGVATSPAIRQMAQVTTAHAFAASVPLASVELGDQTGIALGLNISSGRLSVVHLNLETTVSQQEASPAVAMAGSLGAGKTLTLKKISSGVVDRGGRLLAIDRTEIGEWAALAGAITDASTVDVADPAVSLDPLRVFPGRAGARIAGSCLTALLNIPPSSLQGQLLAEVLDPGWLGARGVNSLGQLQDHLSSSTVPDLEELGRALRTFAQRDFGAVLFDASLPALDVTGARATVFLTHGLQLPSRDEVLHEHLFKVMRLERVFGRAMYALIMGVVRHVAFRDAGEMVAVALAEAHHLTSSPEAEHELIELLRDGRKHGASALLDLHDPGSDLGSDTLRGLIPTRIVGRQDDPTFARNSLSWLGLDPDDRGLVELLTRNTSPADPRTGVVPEERRGEALMRDSRGRVGRIKILAPADPQRRAAVMTTPPTRSRATVVDLASAPPRPTPRAALPGHLTPAITATSSTPSATSAPALVSLAGPGRATTATAAAQTEDRAGLSLPDVPGAADLVQWQPRPRTTRTGNSARASTTATPPSASTPSSGRSRGSRSSATADAPVEVPRVAESAMPEPTPPTVARRPRARRPRTGSDQP